MSRHPGQLCLGQQSPVVNNNWGPPSANFGGLVGYNNGGQVIASYATGSVSGGGTSPNVGGLVGANWTVPASSSPATPRAAVSTAGSGAAGGLVGEAEWLPSKAAWSVNEGEVTDSYWDTESSGQATSAGGTGKASAELAAPTDYTGIYANWNVDLDNADGDNDRATGGDNPWDFGSSAEYPKLRNAGGTQMVSLPATDYDSDDDGLIEVDSLAKLDAIRYDMDGDGAVDDSASYDAAYAAAFPNPATNQCDDPNTGGTTETCTGYELTADLTFAAWDAANPYYNEGKGWQPIGGLENAGWDTGFNAIFEGNGNTISNLFIDRDDASAPTGTDGLPRRALRPRRRQLRHPQPEPHQRRRQRRRRGRRAGGNHARRGQQRNRRGQRDRRPSSTPAGWWASWRRAPS